MKYKLIAAISHNNVIGIEKELPWILPGDLKHFKEITTGNTIVMGWNTWQSIGELPLPNRLNIILSRKKRIMPRNANVKVAKSTLDVEKIKKKGDVFIIGGNQVYNTYMPIIDEMYITRVHTDVLGTSLITFPPVNWEEWELANKSKTYRENNTNYEFEHYVRR